MEKFRQRSGFVAVNVAALFGDAPGPITPDDLSGDWRAEWEERAAIMQYDGGLGRAEAEVLALRWASAVFKRFKEWLEAEGERTAITQTAFGTEMKKLGVEKATSNGVWYKGVVLLDA